VGRLSYYRRIFEAYLTPASSQLTFWHDEPDVNPQGFTQQLGEYYMSFAQKADYSTFDGHGIPVLDYRGALGRQHNPIAVAQWGLGNFNLFQRHADPGHRQKFLLAADWLVDHLQLNPHGIPVWNHHFEWDYRTTLKAPWYSALAQGQGISLLVRAHKHTGESRYLGAAERAFQAFQLPVKNGGITCTDSAGNIWFEEYLVSPPTHILNGFIWASWGVYDFGLATGSLFAANLFDRAVHTLVANLARYDLGYWSLYELAGVALPMLASPFYHRLHITQLHVMYRLTGKVEFRDYAERWQRYADSRLKRTRALALKSAFKLCYY
jgi:heparosan-N-sulfate-glucuronate 5-epimerase